LVPSGPNKATLGPCSYGTSSGQRGCEASDANVKKKKCKKKKEKEN